VIRLENVSKHFPKGGGVVRALDRVSLTVPEGKLALLRGPSGSGKTTLINLAAGLTRPTGGALTVAGRQLERLSTRERSALRARRVAVVFQMFHLVPYLSAFENVLLPTLAEASPDAPARGKELLEALGLQPRADHFPRELSAGERQRCALARALLNRPDVILADEPTGNLDDESARRVIAMLTACRDDGATVLLASHQHVGQVRPDIELLLREGKLEG